MVVQTFDPEPFVKDFRNFIDEFEKIKN